MYLNEKIDKYLVVDIILWADGELDMQLMNNNVIFQKEL